MQLIKREPGYWDKRAKLPGRLKALKSPEQLWKLACEYFTYVDSTPIIVSEVIRGGDRAGEITEKETARPYTWYGLSDFIWSKGIGIELKEYRDNKEGRYSEFTSVIARVAEVLREQKYSGAASGTFKEGLIIKDLQGELEREKAREEEQDTSITINIVK